MLSITANKLIAASALLVLFGSAAFGEVSMPKLLPSPQVMESAPAPANIHSIKGFVFDKGCAKAEPGMEQVNARLKELGLAELPRLKTAQKPGTSGTLWLGIRPNSEVNKLLGGLPDPKAQGYRLAVGKDWIVILGKDVPGLYYGLMTLRQLVESGGEVAGVRISDWPDLKWRGTYIAEPDPEKKIEYFASLKMNFIVFEYRDLYYVDNPAVNARWKKIAEECRKHFIEPIPELQCFGHGHFVVAIDPRTVESVYVEKVPVIARNGSIVASASEDPVPDVSPVNMDFEQDGSGVPNGWNTDDSNGGVVADRSEGHSGQSSMLIKRGDRSTLRVWQDVPCQSECVYNLNCYLKTKDISPNADAEFGGAYAEIYGMDQGGGMSASPLKRTSALKGTNDWSQLSCTVNSAGYKKLRIYMRLQDASGYAWFDDVKLTGVKHEVQILTNAIITDAAPVVLTNKTGDVKYVAGKDFKIIPGDPLVTGDIWTGAPFYPTGGKAPSLEIISGSRIKDGEELLLSYNYAPTGSLSNCPSEPLYNNLMRKSIHNIIKCMNCKYVHIGHDEPQAINRDSRCKARGLSNAELYVDDIKRMREYAIEADPKCRIMMWDDTLNPYANAPGLQLEKAAPLLPRDIIMCSWAYGYPDENERIQKAIAFWTQLGFDITGSCWYNSDNARYWSQSLIEHKNSGHIIGSFYTAWLDDRAHTWLGLDAFSEYSWNGKGESNANAN